MRKPGAGGAGGDEANDMMTPLHLCCSWGLEDTAQALIEHGAKVNAKVGLEELWSLLIVFMSLFMVVVCLSGDLLSHPFYRLV